MQIKLYNVDHQIREIDNDDILNKEQNIRESSDWNEISEDIEIKERLKKRKELWLKALIL